MPENKRETATFSGQSPITLLKREVTAARDKLIDISGKNRLVSFRPRISDIVIVNELIDNVVEDLVSGKSFSFLSREDFEAHYGRPDEDDEDFVADNDSDGGPDHELLGTENADTGAQQYQDTFLNTPYDTDLLYSRLGKLFKDQRSQREEMGHGDVHLGVGFLAYSDIPDTKAFMAPLLMVPVEIERRRMGQHGGHRAHEYFVHPSESPPTVNLALQKRLENDFDFYLPDLYEDESTEAYLTRVERIIHDSPHVNKEHTWAVRRLMVVGVMNFGRVHMWRDLDTDSWADLDDSGHPSVLNELYVKRNVEAGTKLTESLVDCPDGEPQVEFDLVTDADTSQYSALIDILRDDRSLALEGPPGTGKSQTITNLIAGALSMERRVLFVAEKTAALEVVANNMGKLGLREFCLEIHGTKGNTPDVYKQLEARLETQAPNPHNQRLQLKKKQLQARRNSLMSLSRAMTATIGPEQRPAHELVWHAENLCQRMGSEQAEIVDEISVSVDVAVGDYPNLQTLVGQIATRWADIPETDRELWRAFSPDPSSLDTDALERFLGTAADACRRLDEAFARLLPQAGRPEPATWPRLSRLFRDVELAPLYDHRHPIAISVLKTHGEASLDDLTSICSDYDQAVQAVSVLFTPNDNHRRVDTIERALRSLQACELTPEDELSKARVIRDNASTAFEAVVGVQRAAESLTEITGRSCRGVREAEKLLQCGTELLEMPETLLAKANEELVGTESRATLQAAIARAHELMQRQDRLARTWHTDKEIDLDQFSEALNLLDGFSDVFLPVRKKTYRQLRKVVRTYMRQPKSFRLEVDFVISARRFVSWHRESAEFSKSPELAELFGPLFRGLDTDWDGLQHHLAACQHLADTYGATQARQMLRIWSEVIDSVRAAVSRLKATLPALREWYEGVSLAPGTLEDLNMLCQEASRRAEEADKALLALEQAGASLDCTLFAAREAVSKYDTYRQRLRQRSEHPIYQDAASAVDACDNSELETLSQTISALLEGSSERGPSLKKSQLLAWISGEHGDARQRMTELREPLFEFRECLLALRGGMAAQGDIDIALLWRQCVEADSPAGHLQKLAEHTRWLPRIADCRAQANRLAAPAQAVLGRVFVQTLTPANAGIAFEYLVARRVCDAHINGNPDLAEAMQLGIDEVRGQFADLDAQIMQSNAQAIRHKLVQCQLEPGVRGQRVSQHTDMVAIRHNLNKQRRRDTLRSLFSRASTALQQMHPCLMMSPTHVAQVLTRGEFSFDLVVMDEASQMRPEDAIGALSRAKRAVIVGDPKQMPPYRFGDKRIDFDEDEEAGDTEVGQVQSILDMAINNLPMRRLTYHYRSRHESLIEFSNQHYYEGDLRIVPSPEAKSRRLGVHATYVEDGEYAQHKNREEAAALVQNVLKQLETEGADRSVGIVALNRQQSDLIYEMLERERTQRDVANDAMDALEREGKYVFVKNLENVQGDERDIIFISTVRAPGPDGKVSQRFGLLNQVDGWKRMNVLITRARERIEVFTSMTPDQLAPRGRDCKDGVTALKRYLEYAFNGRLGAPQGGVASGRETDSPFEDAVIALLRDMGYTAIPQVGVSGFFIDIGVVNPDHPDEYLLGVECDGATYHSQRYARERDRLRQETLKDQGWEIHRIWSTSWFQNRQVEIDRLCYVIDTRRAERAEALAVAATPEMHLDSSYMDQLGQDSIEDEQKSLRGEIESILVEEHGSDLDVEVSQRVIKTLLSEKPVDEASWAHFSAALGRGAPEFSEGAREQLMMLIAEYS